MGLMMRLFAAVLVLFVSVHQISALPTNTQPTDSHTPCCQGRCKVQGEEKYWSIAKGILGGQHCGEACMKPSQYNLYHFFEKNLTKSDSDTPCHDFGFTKYDSTPTHGFGPVSMTLDLYDKPTAAEADVTLYKVDKDGDEVGQATLDAKYEKAAVAFAGLKEGTCASQGYTVADGTQTMKVPVLGSITISKFKKASMDAQAPPAQGDVSLATFDGAPATTWDWQAVNDPVMGGQSVGNFTADSVRKLAVWQGEVKIVPFLHAAGFCNAQAPPMGQEAHFPVADGTKGICLRARTLAGSELTKFNLQLMTTGAKHLFKQGVYSANYTLTTGDLQDVCVPWEAFTCNWRGESVKWCPEVTTQLGKISNVGVGSVFPGKPGKFHVEIESISAVNHDLPSA